MMSAVATEFEDTVSGVYLDEGRFAATRIKRATELENWCFLLAEMCDPVPRSESTIQPTFPKYVEAHRTGVT